MAVYEATISIRDDKRRIGTHRFYLNVNENDPDEAVGNQAAQLLADYIAAIDPFLDGQIIRASLSRLVTLPVGIKTAPLPDSDVEAGVKIFLTTLAGFKVVLRVPTWQENELDASGILPTASLGYQTLDLWLTNTLETPAEYTVDPSDQRGDGLRTIRSIRESFKP